MTDANEQISIELPREMALALFEWSYRFTETLDSTLTHPADAVVIDYLASELEEKLPEVRTEAYPSRLDSGRRRVVESYRTGMPPQHSAWLDALRCQDLER